MTGRWQGSTRKATLPPDWPTIRRRILKRDGGRCTWMVEPTFMPGQDQPYRCARPATDVDHIDDPDDHSDENLRSLCSPHHDKRSSSQGVAARQAIRARGKRPPEPHPGVRR